MPEGFTEQQVREAASEAGISPVELRQALVERETGALVPRAGAGVPALQGVIAAAPAQALTTVQRALEQQSQRRGHAQGEGRYDIVDDDVGLTYRISSSDDGAGGALVRIDVDTAAGRGALALAGAGTGGVALTVLCLGWLFGVTALWIAGLGIGVLGGVFIARNAMALARAQRRGEALAAQALVDAQGPE